MSAPSEHTPAPFTPLSGGCQCGAVRYVVKARPRNPHVCHCRMCQKAVGGPFAALAEVDLADFAWTRGAPSWFRSSAAVERGFCAGCGTPLHFRYVSEARIDVTIATLDDPQAITPHRQYGVESRLSWTAHVHELAASTTESTTPPDRLALYRSRQHPDHDTDRW